MRAIHFRGRPSGPRVVEVGDDFLFEEFEEGFGIHVVLVLVVVVFDVGADSPAGLGVVLEAFDPPAVEDGEVDRAVDGPFHAGGSGGFHRAARGVEPHVDALHQVARDVHVVIFNEYHAGAHIFALAEFHDVLDVAFAAVVPGVGFAGEDKLEGAITVLQEFDEAFLVAEQKGGAFVGGEAAGEADGEGFGIEDFIDAGDVGGGGAAAGELGAQAVAHEGDEVFAAAFMGAPEFGVGYFFDAIPHFVVGGFVGPVGADVAGIEIGEFIGEPGLGMHAVGDRADGDFFDGDFGPDGLPHAARDIAVEGGDAVAMPGGAEGEHGHAKVLMRVALGDLAQVKELVAGEAELGVVAAQVAFDDIGVKGIVAGGNGGVGGKDVGSGDQFQRLAEGEAFLFHEHADSLQRQEG